ncbi:MAG: hypothetical protein JOZ87_05860 [Chloroflexi bacterium]|nr:hypothetical protein [Chloroflexota bacterium]
MSVQLHVLLDASFFGRKYRLKSALRLCQELDWLHDKYRISHFALTHDLFTVNKDKVREFCMQVAGRGYTWTCSARMDCVDPALLEDMYSAGCRSIYYGVETGSARMQKMVDKHLDLALFAPTLDSSRKVGLAATASFITGFPTKEQSDQDDTLDMIGSCFSRYPAGVTLQLHLLTPEPGTRLMTDFAEFVDYDGHISDFNFPTLESDDRAVIRRHPAVFMNQYFYRTVLPRRQHVFVTAVHPVLYRLGFRVLRHLLSYYNGRYSRLLRSMFDWASTQDQSVPLDNLVCNYMEATWGREHYLTSLVRYLLAAARLEISPLPGAHVVLMPTAREVATTTPKQGEVRFAPGSRSPGLA